MLNLYCWLFGHSNTTKFKSTKPDEIVKETITCSKCGFEKVIYWV